MGPPRGGEACPRPLDARVRPKTSRFGSSGRPHGSPPRRTRRSERRSLAGALDPLFTVRRWGFVRLSGRSLRKRCSTPRADAAARRGNGREQACNGLPTTACRRTGERVPAPGAASNDGDRSGRQRGRGAGLQTLHRLVQPDEAEVGLGEPHVKPARRAHQVRGGAHHVPDHRPQTVLARPFRQRCELHRRSSYAAVIESAATRDADAERSPFAPTRRTRSPTARRAGRRRARGSGRWPTSCSPGPSRSSTCSTPSSTCGTVAKAIYGPGTDMGERWAKRRRDELDGGRLAELLRALRRHEGRNEARAASTTSAAIATACATRSSAPPACASPPACSKRAASTPSASA